MAAIFPRAGGFAAPRGVAMPTIAEALALAGKCLQNGKVADAERICRQLLSSNPRQAEVHNLLGVSLVRQNKLDEAVASFQQAVRFQPDAVDLLVNLGNALRLLGRFEEAETS